MNNPKVSIGLPVYNGEKYIKEALDSILCQDFKDFELIISDNGSDDNTENICRQYAKSDKRIFYHRNDRNKGAAWNYNHVFKLSRGQYFKWASHDDVCLPGFLSECIKLFDGSSSSVVLVYPQCQFIDADGKVLYDDTDVLETKHNHAGIRLAYILQNVNMANAIFGLIRSDALKKTRLIDTFIASDYVLLAELAMLGEFWEVHMPLSLRRIHSGASRYANLTNKEVAAWFDTSRDLSSSLLHKYFPNAAVRSRLVVEWIRSACRIPSSGSERVICCFVIPVVYGIDRLRNYGGLWKIRLKRLCGMERV